VRFGDRIGPDRLASTATPRCATVGGLSLHANVAVPARDRARLERLCRYVARPPLAIERLSRLPDGRVLYELRHPWRDGTTHVAFLPLEFVEKLAALIPAPRANLVRYHGILAPAALHRAAVIPRPANDEPAERPSSPERADTHPAPRRRNYSWAELMLRVFDRITECTRPRRSDGPSVHHASLSPAPRARDCRGGPAAEPSRRSDLVPDR